MGLNDTPSSERVQIGIFGRTNAGKSSLINAITSQNIAIVNKTAGTTTDPVYKAMELLPLGPVMIIDTPGIDDEGELGELRVKASYKALNKCDMALLVAEAGKGLLEEDKKLLEKIKAKKIPYIIVYNKTDEAEGSFETGENEVYVSAKTKNGIEELKEKMARAALGEKEEKRITAGIVKEGETAVLVVPIDSAAPKGRLILPQQQTIRDLLDGGAEALVVKETGLKDALGKLKEKPKIVITDSQAFENVAKHTPDDVLLTSFSILFANYKGDLAVNVRAARKLDGLSDGDVILISEGCTHHRQCDDIGTVKMPRWIKGYTKKDVDFEFTSGGEFPEDLSKYALIVHCGACMLNEKEMKYRISRAEDEGAPIVNYGIAIAYMHGILERSLRALPEIHAILEK